MSDVLVEGVITSAPPSLTNDAFPTSPSTFSTFTLKPTSIGSHHAAVTSTLQELVHDANDDWLSRNYSNSASEIFRRNENVLRGIRLGIGFGAATFAILLIGAVYVGIRCCRKKPLDAEDSSSMEISGVQYEMREEYGPKPISRCSTCDTDAVRAESSLRADPGWSGSGSGSGSERPRSQDIIEGDWRTEEATEDGETTRAIHSV